ncbi:PREDICTED: protein GRIM REAPER-like [Camelina sativa]|uniref:Protein GRIM REAPER-like n=1 Tax=Camelina sativa TaxID=90675 RepID=A0ABM0VWP9_CAMSA|nr:PREDICTED: protein GRIM REAPER-like [Camelina sativa]XP_010462176.1 PREDICTED: protein GRIM REAPER-like [Camelina sativa]
MAIKLPNTFIKATSLLSLILYFLITATLSPTLVLADEDVVDQDEDPEYYILDEAPSILSNMTISSKTRLLVSQYKKIKKGMRCHVVSYNICNGVKANNGTSLLNCCKKHCRNILGDMNNCGRCGHKCGFGQRCCGGVCTYVNFNPNHCGKCTRKCASGVKCEYGYCGYA